MGVRKRLLMVIPTIGTGGAEKLVIDIINELAKDEKYEVFLMCLYGQESLDGIYRSLLNLDDAHIKFIEKRKGFDIRAQRNALKIVKEIKPDIIHTHIDTVFSMLFSYRYAKVRLHTVHNIAEEEAKGLQLILRKIAFSVFKVKPIAISDSVRKSIAVTYRIRESSVPVVYNGIKISEYQGRIRENTNCIKIVAVGTFKPQKNYFEMLNVFYALSRLGVPFTCSIVGSGVLFDRVVNQIREMNLDKNVDCVGETIDVKSYLDNADLFLSTSSFEGLPISMLEAMANGLPIVATRVGGVPDIVKDGVNGFLYELGDVSQAAQFIKRIVESGMLPFMSENALNESLKYSIESCTQGYVRIYEGDN